MTIAENTRNNDQVLPSGISVIYWSGRTLCKGEFSALPSIPRQGSSLVIIIGEMQNTTRVLGQKETSWSPADEFPPCLM